MIEHTPLYQAMKDAVRQTFENMAFTEVLEHYDQDFKIPEAEIVWATLVIKNPLAGEICLALAKSALKELTAAIFLLEKNEVTKEKMTDILHELLNTISGLFMTKLLADNQPFQIGLPASGEGQLPECEGDSVCWKLITGDEQALQIFLSGAPIVALND